MPYADKEKQREANRKAQAKRRGYDKAVTPEVAVDVTPLSGMDAHMRRSWESVARCWVEDKEGMRRLIGPLAKKEMEARKNGGDETYIVRWGCFGPTLGEIAEVFLA